MKNGDKLSNFIALYRLPNQSQVEFETYVRKLQYLDSISANHPEK